MDKFQIIEKQVLERITPSPLDREKLKETITTLSKRVQEELKKQDIPVTIELVGSTAKDTYLKNNLDIDLFFVFPVTTPEKMIATITLSIGRNILTETEECYAEHPYIRGNFLNYKVELVPSYQITDASEKISAVDRTPFHTRYIKNHLKEKQKQDVRLLKQFLKGINCYGAEAEIQGFSGYLCELLILKFNSFQKLLSLAQYWKKQTKLSLTNHPIASFLDPLIFIDPVDPERNVAAAVSPHSFQRFITACKSYLSQPKKTFFFPRPLTPWTLQKIKDYLDSQPASYVGIRFNKPHIINENLYPQLRKACKAIETASMNEGFNIHDSCFHIDITNDIIYLIIKTDDQPLSETYTHMGPPIKLQKNTKEFIEKWTKHPSAIPPPFQKNERMYVTVRRSYRYLSDYLKKNLLNFSLGRHIDATLSQQYTVLHQVDLIRPELSLFWTAYLDEKKPWDR